MANTADYGGGVYVVWGSATLSGAQIVSNTAIYDGGGVYVYEGSAALSVGQIVGNAATHYGGGGLYAGGGTTAITFTPVASNTASSGGYGIHRAGGTVLVHDTIVAYNGTTTNNCSGGLISNGHNLEYGDTCNLTATTDITDTNPLLGPLTYDGNTWVHALLQCSPAINAGLCVAGIPTDQRGFTRVPPCDIGAYEYVLQVYLPLVLRSY